MVSRVPRGSRNAQAFGTDRNTDLTVTHPGGFGHQIQRMIIDTQGEVQEIDNPSKLPPVQKIAKLEEGVATEADVRRLRYDAFGHLDALMNPYHRLTAEGPIYLWLLTQVF